MHGQLRDAWELLRGRRQGVLGARALRVRARDALVRVDVVGARRARPLLRARARFPLPAGPAFTVYPEGLLDKLEKLFGAIDLPLGRSPRFDEHFMVKSSDAVRTGIAWSPRAADLMMRQFPDGFVSSDGREVVLTSAGPIGLPDRLEAAIDLVGELVAADLFGFAALRALPDARYLGADGAGPARVELSMGSRVVLAPIALDGGVRTRASMFTAMTRCFRRRIDEHGRADGWLPDPVLAQSAGPGLVEVSAEELSFTWDGVETDPRRLMAGVHVLLSFHAAPGRGVYR